MKIFSAFLICAPALAIVFQPIKTPILPVYLGPITVIKNYHSFIYSIDLSPMITEISNLKLALRNGISNEITNTSLYPTNSMLKRNLDLAINQISRIENVITQRLDQLIVTKQKRGLLNLVGKVDKYLFGTMDADDEKYFNDQIQLIRNNQYKLSLDLAKQKSVLLNITEAYNKKITKISQNQQILVQHLNEVIKSQTVIDYDFEFLELQQTLELIKQEYLIALDFINQIHTSISLAKMNILHPTIISPAEFKEILYKMKLLYPNETITFIEPHSYYEFLETSVRIYNNKIYFYIHYPIPSTKHQNLYHLYPVPLKDFLPIINYPYYLFGTHSPPGASLAPGTRIEDKYYIRYDFIQRAQECLATLLTENKYTCDSIRVTTEEPIVLNLIENSNKVLVIPKNKTCVTSMCEEETQKNWITEPVLLTLNQKCSAVIEKVNFSFSGTAIKHSVNVIEPIMTPRYLHPNRTDADPVVINKVHLEKMELIKEQLKGLEISNLQTDLYARDKIDLTSIILIVVILAVFITLVSVRWYKKKYFRSSTNPHSNVGSEPPQTIVQQNPVLFSQLRGEE